MIGIDIIEIKRIKKLLKNHEKTEKIFFESEINYCKKYKICEERFAGFFCAKEAVIKAFNVPKNSTIKQVEITHEKGVPKVILHGKLKEEFEKKYRKIEISISHSKKYAVAICKID